MPKFSRDTIVKLIEALHFRTNDQVLRFDLRFGLDLEYSGGIEPKETAIMRYLVDNPDATGPMGGSLVVEIIEDIIQRDLEAPERTWGLSGGAESFEDRYPELTRSLKRDGYVVDGGKLKTMLPDELQLPEKEDEMKALLAEFGFGLTRHHYDEAVAAHTRGDWAAANAQMRTFIESLFDAIADWLVHDKACLPKTSHGRRQLLAQLEPPFLLPDLNEWEIDGKGGFVQGVWRRLCPKGSHPGRSDEEDSTFRLHLVILVASHYLRRLRDEAPKARRSCAVCGRALEMQVPIAWRGAHRYVLHHPNRNMNPCPCGYYGDPTHERTCSLHTNVHLGIPLLAAGPGGTGGSSGTVDCVPGAS